jgi:ribosomal protein S12 methylthiotransferase accessory factor
LVKFRSCPKTWGLTRTVSAQETIRTVKDLAKSFGVTRVADITGLDRIGIPVASAVVPKSDDFLTIYSGKGSRRVDAIAGALMEAIERQAVLRARPRTITASPADLRRHENITEPVEILTALSDAYSDERSCEWVEGYDLLQCRSVFVPAATAGYCCKHLASPAPHAITSAHGLSAGNCIEEAVSQSLCEWVERDAWTLAELTSHWRRRAFAEAAAPDRSAGDPFEDDFELFPCIDFSGIGEPVEGLLRRYRRAGMEPIVRDISSDIGIPVVLATVAEDEIPGFPQAHFGVGAHPDLRVAAARALTEAAQSRAGDIQGVREDLAPPEGDGDAKGVVVHTRRVKRIDRNRWMLRASSRLRWWQEIEEHRQPDILADIELLLSRLKRAGIRQAAVVGFSPPDSVVSVVRMVVPGLEMWIADRGRVGERAAAAWNRRN